MSETPHTVAQTAKEALERDYGGGYWDMTQIAHEVTEDGEEEAHFFLEGSSGECLVVQVTTC